MEAAPAETQEDVAGVSVDEAIGQEGAGAAVPGEAGPVTEVPDDGGPVTAQELMQMIAESGDTIPPSDINEFAGYVSELTGQKIPATLKARRAAIANWYAEQAPPIAAHTPPDSARRRAAAALAQNPDAAFERPPMPPDRETVLRPTTGEPHFFAHVLSGDVDVAPQLELGGDGGDLLAHGREELCQRRDLTRPTHCPRNGTQEPISSHQESCPIHYGLAVSWYALECRVNQHHLFGHA